MKPFTCYRGQYILREELEKLEFSTGHLVAVNSFFSASKSSETATFFSGNGEQHKHGLESVIFKIEINPSVCRKPFGEVTHGSIMLGEREVLFSIGSLFRVKSVELNIGSISHIILELTDEVSNELTNLRQFYQNEHIGENPSIVLFGLFLSKRGTLDQAENFYHRILEELPKDHQDVGVIYINLGEVLRHQGYLQLAQLYFTYPLDIFAKTVTESHPYYAIAYSNLGSVYSSCGQDRIALQYYKEALRVLETDKIYTSYRLISTVYHGMAVAYQHLEDTDSAFISYKKVLDLEQEILPMDHPSLSLTYGNLAELNGQMGEQILAREQFEKALSIMENSLPRNHLEHAIILLKYGYFLWKIERNASKAVTYYQYAVGMHRTRTFEFDEFGSGSSSSSSSILELELEFSLESSSSV
jgi:tetratricopeptide (TPR) repeat protein